MVAGSSFSSYKTFKARVLGVVLLDICVFFFPKAIVYVDDPTIFEPMASLPRGAENLQDDVLKINACSERWGMRLNSSH